MNSYEEKQEARRERLEQAAERAKTESDAAFKRAHSIHDGIPFGQPILVGHHSEKRHRRDLAKADNALRRGVEASKEAAELARRAEAVGTAGISSDDPEAVAKLEDKRTDLEKERDRMKAVNATFRKAKGDSAAKLAACVTAGLLAPNAAMEIAQVTFGLCNHDMPYPAYELTNIGARIRQAKKRAEAIVAREATPAHEPVVVQTAAGEVRIVENADDNRVQIFFPGKPDVTVREELKRFGFHFSPINEAWQRMRSNGAWYWATSIVGKLAVQS